MSKETTTSFKFVRCQRLNYGFTLKSKKLMTHRSQALPRQQVGQQFAGLAFKNSDHIPLQRFWGRLSEQQGMNCRRMVSIARTAPAPAPTAWPFSLQTLNLEWWFSRKGFEEHTTWVVGELFPRLTLPPPACPLPASVPHSDRVHRSTHGTALLLGNGGVGIRSWELLC